MTDPAPDSLRSAAADTKDCARASLVRLLCFAQGGYFLLTGIWPIVSIGTFQAVTGPKTDLWLVKTVAVLVIVLALVLLTSAWRKAVSPETRVAAIGGAAGLMLIDVVYATAGVIPPIYLADAVVEVVLVIAWLALGKPTPKAGS